MKKTKRLFSVFLTLCILVLGVTGCSSKNNTNTTNNKDANTTTYPITITDSYKRQVKIEKEPTSIVSLSPAVTETVYAIGLGDKLVGRTDYCNYPEEVSKVKSIGTITEPNIEAIVALKPDIVIGSSLTTKEVVSQLENLGVKVAVIFNNEDFEGVYSTINSIASIFGNETKDKAASVVSSMKTKIEDVQKKVSAASSSPKVYYVVGFGEYGDFTAGGDTFVDKILTTAGGTNIAKDVQGWNYSLEKLIENNPDIIICPLDQGGKEAFAKAENYKDLNAVKENKVYDINQDLINVQGPRIADGVEAMAKIIHPELFK